MTPEERLTKYFLSEARRIRQERILWEEINAAMAIAKVKRTVFFNEERTKHITYYLN